MNSKTYGARAPTALLLMMMTAALLAACGGGEHEDEDAGAKPSAAPRERPAQATAALPGLVVPADAHVNGLWGPVQPWPLIPLHAVLLPDGRVMSYGTTREGKQSGYFIYDVWDPAGGFAAGSHLTLPNATATDLFCSAQGLLPGGTQVVLSGGDNWTGTRTTNTGNAASTVFDVATNALTPGAAMNRPRWYATATTLPGGEMLLMGGQGGADRPEVRGADGRYRLLSGADTSALQWNYPRNFVAPDGRIFGFDAAGQMYYLDARGAGTLVPAGGFAGPRDADSSAAMFSPGRILQFGGATAQAIVIDINRGTPVVAPTQPLSSARRLVTSTILPDGKVLATGGSRVYNELVDVNTSAEIWDPRTGQWHAGARGVRARLYHSMALLLPDGAVLVGGGGAPGPQVNTNVEVYYPPYLFTPGGQVATRPRIDTAPTVTEPGRTLQVGVISTRAITRATLVRHGAVTHGFNNEQRFVDLAFRQQGSQLALQVPSRAADVPPGLWMLFVFDDAGVPSIARSLRIGVASAPTTAVSPVLAALADRETRTGAPVELQPAATDPNADPLQWAAAGLPPGLTINANSGRIAGTPSLAGPYTVTLSASDGYNAATRSFVWRVTGDTAALVVQRLDAGASGAASVAGATAAFQAAASTTGVEWLWDFGDGTPPAAGDGNGRAGHVYAMPGVYAVGVSVRDALGRNARSSFLHVVSLPPAGALPPGAVPAASSSLLFEPRAGGAHRVWMLNPDHGTVAVFNAATQARVAEIAVAKAPRALALGPEGRVWVVNKGAARLSLIDTATLAVVRDVVLPRGSQPHGLVMSPDRRQAYVALEATGELLRIDTTSFAITARLAVGPVPRHLAIDARGERLWVSRHVTAVQPGESTAGPLPAPASAAAATGGEVVLVSTATMQVEGRVVLAHSTRPDSETTGRGVPNYLGATAISPDGRQAFVPSKQDNIHRGLQRDGQALDFQNTVRAIASRIALDTRLEDHAARIDLDNAGLASAALFDASGSLLFVALETSREVAIIDAHRRVELMRVEVGRAPQALVLAADGKTLYVDNQIDRRLAVIDLRPLRERGELPARVATLLPSSASEPLAPPVLLGKQLFYDARDPRLARDRYMSCAACHSEAGHDGRVWDITAAGEGLRRTLPLRGKAREGGHGFLHWSGNFDEVQDFEGQIRTLAGGTGLMSDAQFNTGTVALPLGDRKAGRSAELDALAAYVASLTTHDASPHFTAVGPVPPAVARGQAMFRDLGCGRCHAGDAFTGSGDATLIDIGTLRAGSGRRLGQPLTGIDPPSLRGLWAANSYLHDGRAATLQDAVRAHRGVALADAPLADLVAYLRTISSDTPTAPLAAGSGTGLNAAYFANATLAGAAALQRQEAVDFSWAGAAPGAGLPADGWSVRWRGQIELPASGTYRLEVTGDDGVRVWLDGRLVLDRWARSSGNETTLIAPLNGNAGQRLPIVIEHVDRSGDSTLRLRWKTPGSPQWWLPVPAAWLHAGL